MTTTPNTPADGIKFSREEIQEILASLDPPLELGTYEQTNLGFNNKVAFLATPDGQQLVLKAGGRYWKQQKTESEVAGHLITARCLPDVQVPRLIGFSSHVVRENVVGKYEWVLSERVGGESMTVAWAKLDHKSKIHVAKEIANIIVSFHTVPLTSIQADLSGRVQSIGNLSLTPPEHADSGLGHDQNTYRLYDPKSPIFVSNILNGPPPCSSYLEYVQAILGKEIANLELSIERGSYLAELHALRLPRLKALCKTIVQNPLLQQLNKDVRWRPTFTHGDFQPQNIMIRVTKDIRAEITILDWEWCGFFPPNVEWDAGLSNLVNFLKREGDLNLDGIFLDILEQSGLVTPRNGGELWACAVKASRLIEYVDPWWLAGYPKNGGTGAIKEVIDKKRTEAVLELDKLLDMFIVF